MEITPSAEEWTALAAAAGQERRVRVWRRNRAVLLLGDGQPASAVATALGCSPSSVYGWAAAWRRHGVDGVQGHPHGGGRVPLATRAGAVLETLLTKDPQERGHRAAGWTGPLLLTELAAACSMTGRQRAEWRPMSPPPARRIQANAGGNREDLRAWLRRHAAGTLRNGTCWADGG